MGSGVRDGKTSSEAVGRYYLSERRYGSFERSLRLPECANRDKVEARFSKGVLTIAFPKTKEALQKTKKIKIKGE